MTIRNYYKKLILLFCFIFFILSYSTNATGELLFEDNFDSGTMSDEWLTKAPEQWVQDGWLHTKDTDGWPRDSMAVVRDSDTSWVNYELSITVDPFETDSPWTHANVLFRTDDFIRASGISQGRAYQLQIYNRGLQGQILQGIPNYVSLHRTDHQSDPSSILLGEVSQVLSPDPMEVKVRLMDDHISVSIDGMTLIDVIDLDPLPCGGIGIHAVWETEARFDNVFVYEIPPTYSCAGYEPPMDSSPVTVKGKNRALPFKAELKENGSLVTDADIYALPVIQVLYNSGQGGDPIDVTDNALPAGQGTEGNEFVFTDEGKWQFNLKLQNYTAPGTYTVIMVSGNELEYRIEPTCEALFVIK